MWSIILNAASAIFFLLSAVCWITASSIKHPNVIDGGRIGDVEEPKDWFWAYRRATKWNSWAARFAAAGAICACLVGAIEICKRLSHLT